jgi:hypothetical protein
VKNRYQSVPFKCNLQRYTGVLDPAAYPKLTAVVDAVAAIPALHTYYVGMGEENPKYEVFAGEK